MSSIRCRLSGVVLFLLVAALSAFAAARPDEEPGLGRAPLASYSLQPYIAYPTGGGDAAAVAIGDVTADGSADVVVTTDAAAYDVLVYPQVGGGSLGTPPARYAYGSTASGDGLVLADLNEDGILDVVVGHSTGISVLLADGLGGLGAAAVTVDADAGTLASMDVDLDGHIDIISLGATRGATMFFGDGLGGFSRKEALATNAGGRNDHEVEDLTGDGFIDLGVMSGQGTPNLTVHEHDTVSSFLPGPDTYSMGPSELSAGVGLGDVTGDCLNDAVLSRARNSPTWLWIMAQDGGGGLTGPTTIDSYDIPEPVEVADIDMDGREDVAVVHGGWTRVGIYIQQAGGGLGAEQLYVIPYASHYAPQGLAVGDFSSDGCADVAIADYNNGLVVLYGQGCAASCDLQPAASAGLDISVCAGDAALLDGSASSSCSGAIGLLFEWRQASTVVRPWSRTPTCPLTPAVAGTYTLRVARRETPACIGADTVEVTVGPRPAADAGPDASGCVGETLRLDGSATPPCAAPAATLYRWVEGAAEICGWSSTPTCDAAPGSDTTYTLEVACSNAPGCVDRDTVDVTAWTPPTAEAGPEAGVCAGETITLNGSASAACAAPAANLYRWLQGAAEICGWSSAPTCDVAPGSDTTYTLEAACTDAPGCAARDTVMVRADPIPPADAGPDSTSCVGGAALLDASGTSNVCTPPDAPYYRWLAAAVEVCPPSLDPTCQVSPAATTVYTLEVTCPSASCTCRDTVTVDPRSAPPAAAPPDRTVCAGEQVVLDAAGSGPCAAPGELLARWLEAATVLCDWSPGLTCTATPSAGLHDYTLEVACDDAPSCVGRGATRVTAEPDVAPPSLGNTLRAVKSGGDVALTWATEPLAYSYSLYRGTQRGAWPPPVREGLPGPGSTEPDVAGPPFLFFYRAAGASCSGAEGP